MTKIDTTKTAAEIAQGIMERSKARADKAAIKRTKQEAKDEKTVKAAIAAKKAAKPAKKGKKVATPKVAPTPKAKKEPPLCLCGCKELTKGGKFRPGHDARYHAAQKGPKIMPDCGCGCKTKTKGGRFLPGHDAKYNSALLQKEKAAKAAKSKSAIPAPKATSKPVAKKMLPTPIAISTPVHNTEAA